MGEFFPDTVMEGRVKLGYEAIRSKKHISFQDQVNEKYYDNIVYPIVDEEKRVYRLAVFGKDITEQKKEELANLETKRVLEEQRVHAMQGDRLRSLGEMAAGIAHELAQPLTGVRGIAEHLSLAMDRGWKIERNKIRESFDTIIEQADRMVHLIEHVRMFAREAGKTEVSRVNINNVIESVEQMIGQQMKAHGLYLVLDLDSGLPSVLVNPFSLEEVLLNIVSNARDAVEEQLQKDPQGDNRIRVRTFVDSKQDRKQVVMEVTDRGVGIPKAILPKVYDPFFTTKGPDRGTGLGLSISKSIVEDYGGALTIEHLHGGGTKVTIMLPSLSSSKRKRQTIGRD